MLISNFYSDSTAQPILYIFELELKPRSFCSCCLLQFGISVFANILFYVYKLAR